MIVFDKYRSLVQMKLAILTAFTTGRKLVAFYASHLVSWNFVPMMDDIVNTGFWNNVPFSLNCHKAARGCLLYQVRRGVKLIIARLCDITIPGAGKARVKLKARPSPVDVTGITYRCDSTHCLNATTAVKLSSRALTRA